MTRGGDRPQIQLTGLRRGREVRGAVLVLRGARRVELQRASALAGMLADQCLLIAVDGGLKACRGSGRRPDLYVGDRDSVKHVPARVPSVVYPSRKDFNDLSGALSEARRRGVQVITLAGVLGGRLDHEWANLQEIGAHASRFAGILAPTHRGMILVTARSCRVSTVRDQTVSLLPLGGAATVTLHGTSWRLRRRRLRPGSHGLSNVTGTTMHLVVHSGVVALVFPNPSASR
jgi:thiamine pyrophosphokinase